MANFNFFLNFLIQKFGNLRFLLYLCKKFRHTYFYTNLPVFYALFTHNTRTIDAQYTHYSKYFRGDL
jgi:hypothetical protein